MRWFSEQLKTDKKHTQMKQSYKLMVKRSEKSSDKHEMQNSLVASGLGSLSACIEVKVRMYWYLLTF